MKKLLMVLSIIGFIFAEGKISGVTYFDFSATDTKSAFSMCCIWVSGLGGLLFVRSISV